MREPNRFSWVIPGQLACMAKPAKLRTDLEFLKDQGIGLVITLTTAPLTRCFIDEFGFEYRHIPIRDFAAPTQEQIDEFVTAVSEARERGTKVLVHCLAGVGRSGAMLSCYLVHGGKTAAEAIAEVRRLRPGSIETPGQEQAVYEYEKRIRKKTRDE